MAFNCADSFSHDYPEARAKFLEAAAAAGGVLDAVAHPMRGPDGGELATDIAWFGPHDAERVLVMLSGTHGVEGFCGSGAQVHWLRRGEAKRLPSGVAVMMLHAVNPYGFAWSRRTTSISTATGSTSPSRRRRTRPTIPCTTSSAPRPGPRRRARRPRRRSSASPRNTGR